MTQAQHAPNNLHANSNDQVQDNQPAIPLSPITQNGALLRSSGVQWRLIDRPQELEPATRIVRDWLSMSLSEMSLPGIADSTANRNTHEKSDGRETERPDLLSASVSHFTNPK